MYRQRARNEGQDKSPTGLTMMIDVKQQHSLSLFMIHEKQTTQMAMKDVIVGMKKKKKAYEQRDVSAWEREGGRSLSMDQYSTPVPYHKNTS